MPLKTDSRNSRHCGHSSTRFQIPFWLSTRTTHLLCQCGRGGFLPGRNATLLRSPLDDLIPFSSPVLEAVTQVRQSAGVMNEYAVGVGTPRIGGERIVDLQATLRE